MNDTITRFASAINRLPIAPDAPLTVRADALDILRAYARAMALQSSTYAPNARRYSANRLHTDPRGWSLAAVVFAPGQATLPHDHESWGCAATMRGVERVRRFSHRHGKWLSMIGERDVRPGDGYLFDRTEVHQVIGAGRRGITVALHLLVQGSDVDRTSQYFSEQMPPDGWRMPIVPVHPAYQAA
jgi:predicted metal-dependent enzyme (double-stranded beta helix superfamily)